MPSETPEAEQASSVCRGALVESDCLKHSPIEINNPARSGLRDVLSVRRDSVAGFTAEFA